ncbi:MAG TPA: hypothetical protein VFE65_37110 [Pseudonocardia sp.]|jgi:uncharacterized membrane protein YqiK|nr:hypothetical protein [Pseudonocardia sp.]
MSRTSGKNARVESTVDRIRELNDRIVDAAREGGEESVKAYERMLENLAQAQEAAGDRGAEWIREVTKAQAAFTRQLAEAVPSLLQRIGLQARDAGDSATATVHEIPGAALAEGVARGAVSREEDLPIPAYDEKNVQQITERLDGLSQVELGRVAAYEARTKNRKTVLDKIETLRT